MLQKRLQRRFNLKGWIQGTRTVKDTPHLIPKPDEHKILGVNRKLKQQRRRRLRKRLLKRESRAASNFISLIPSRLIRQVMAVFSGVEL